MASAWGASFGNAWGNAWGAIAPAPSVMTQVSAGGRFIRPKHRRIEALFAKGEFSFSAKTRHIEDMPDDLIAGILAIMEEFK